MDERIWSMIGKYESTSNLLDGSSGVSSDSPSVSNLTFLFYFLKFLQCNDDNHLILNLFLRIFEIGVLEVE